MEFPFELLIALVCVAVALYLIKLIPGDDTIKQIFRIIVITVVVVWTLVWLRDSFYSNSDGRGMGCQQPQTVIIKD